MQTFIIGKNECGQRFDKFLKKYLPDASSGFIYKMLRKKNITLNSKKASGDEILSEGDCVESFFSDETFVKFHGSVEKFNHTAVKPLKDKQDNLFIADDCIVYEDEDILLVNKAAGILSQKAKDSDYSVNEWLIDHMISNGEISKEALKTFHPSVCNRLDRNTAGIVICGKSLRGIQLFDNLISEKKIEKHYLALCEGKFCSEGRISAFISKDVKNNISKVTSKATSKASDSPNIITEFKILKSYEEATLLDVNLLTGKSHQIRAQLSALGNPIVGDVKYGGSNKLLKTQFLIAYKLIFPEENMLPEYMKHNAGRIFEVSLPENFKKCLSALHEI